MSRSGSPVIGQAVTASDPARLPRPNAAASAAPAPALALSSAPSSAAITVPSAAVLADVTRVTVPTRRSGPRASSSFSVWRTAIAAPGRASASAAGSVTVSRPPASAQRGEGQDGGARRGGGRQDGDERRAGGAGDAVGDRVPADGAALRRVVAGGEAAEPAAQPAGEQRAAHAGGGDRGEGDGQRRAAERERRGREEHGVAGDGGGEDGPPVARHVEAPGRPRPEQVRRGEAGREQRAVRRPPGLGDGEQDQPDAGARVGAARERRGGEVAGDRAVSAHHVMNAYPAGTHGESAAASDPRRRGQPAARWRRALTRLAHVREQ